MRIKYPHYKTHPTRSPNVRAFPLKSRQKLEPPQHMTAIGVASDSPTHVSPYVTFVFERFVLHFQNSNCICCDGGAVGVSTGRLVVIPAGNCPSFTQSRRTSERPKRAAETAKRDWMLRQ